MLAMTTKLVYHQLWTQVDRNSCCIVTDLNVIIKAPPDLNFDGAVKLHGQTNYYYHYSYSWYRP